MTAEIIRPAAFQRPNIQAVEEAPQRTAEQIALLNEVNAVVADAISTARLHARMGNRTAANERCVTAARELTPLYDATGLPEILALIQTMYQRAREFAPPRRRWRQRPGSVVGFLGAR